MRHGKPIDVADPMVPSDPMVGAKRQCTVHTKTGRRCKCVPIRGGTVCYKHGGGAPQVKRAARNRIAHLIDPAIEVLEERLQDKTDPGHALSAAKDVLDRAGLKTARSST